MRKIADKSRDILPNNQLVVFRSANVMKDKERVRNCDRLEETKEA